MPDHHTTKRINPASGWAHSKTLPRGPGGRCLCRGCGTEVPKGRRTFCSAACVHSWRLLSDPGYVRAKTFERDRGVCAKCGLDTKALGDRLRQLPFGERGAAAAYHGFNYYETLWHADHVVPVIEGGGQCGLDNIRTLCVPCHKIVTAALRQRLAAKRRTDG